jgi:hypothetical protein
MHLWHCPLQSASPFRRLDWLLRNTARVLQSWSDKIVGIIGLQLAMAKDVLLQLEATHDTRSLEVHEESLRQWVKLKTLGLSSLQHSMARQESRLLWLHEGDASTKFFHAHANIRRWRNHIHILVVDGNVVHSKEATAQAAHSYFDAMLGTPPPRPFKIKWY